MYIYKIYLNWSENASGFLVFWFEDQVTVDMDAILPIFLHLELFVCIDK